MAENYYDEAEALRLLALGSEQGFRAIYDRYALSVARIGHKYLQSSRMTEDFVQEIFSLLWIHRKNFTSAEHFQGYLYTTTRNLALQHMKRIAREELTKKVYNSLQAVASNNVEHYMEDKDLNQLVLQAVRELPPQCQRIYHMVRDEGLSHKDIADQLHLSHITVSNQMVLALRFIRRRLQGHIVTGVHYLGLSSITLMVG